MIDGDSQRLLRNSSWKRGTPTQKQKFDSCNIARPSQKQLSSCLGPMCSFFFQFFTKMSTQNVGLWRCWPFLLCMQYLFTIKTIKNIKKCRLSLPGLQLETGKFFYGPQCSKRHTARFAQLHSWSVRTSMNDAIRSSAKLHGRHSAKPFIKRPEPWTWRSEPAVLVGLAVSRTNPLYRQITISRPQNNSVDSAA